MLRSFEPLAALQDMHKKRPNHHQHFEEEVCNNTVCLIYFLPLWSTMTADAFLQLWLPHFDVASRVSGCIPVYASEEKRHEYWLLLLNKICVSNDEASVDHDERAVCIRKAAELAAKEGPDQVCFRGQALLCIARAMAKEEAEQALLALEESFHSILATARLPMAARMMSSKQQAAWSAKALVEGMGPRFADTCHRALLADHRPEPLTSAASLRASAQLLHAGLRPKCGALTRCLAQRAATAAGLGADPDDAFEEEAEEREAARWLLRELFCCPRLPADMLSSLVELSARPWTMDGEKEAEPEAVLNNLRHMRQLDAATKAYKRCASHIAASGSKDMVQRLRVSTRLAMRAPGEASNHSELLVGLLGHEADEQLRGETLQQLRRVLPTLQGPGAEVRKVFDAAWAFVRDQGALDHDEGPRESSICAVWLCADALKARRERLKLAPTSPPVPEWRIPCTSEQQLPGADQNAWMQVLARLCSDTQDQDDQDGPPIKRRRLEETEAPALPAAELRRLLVSGATRRWCLAVTTMALEYCIQLGNSGDRQGSLALLSAIVRWLRSSFQEWDLGRRAHRATARWLRGRLSDTLRPSESCLLRRAKRLHRAACEQQLRHSETAALTLAQLRHWRAFLGLQTLPSNQGEAVQIATAVVTREAQRFQREATKRWRHRFWESTAAAVQAGASSLRLSEPPDPNLSSVSMTSNWEPVWTQRHSDPAVAWQEVSNAAGLRPEPSHVDFSCPCADEIVESGSGGAGFDGWNSAGFARACPWLVQELADLLALCLANPSEASDAACRDRFFSWKVVEAAVRPITIASSIVRAWSRSLLRHFSSLPED
eukprot:s4356_g6.t1